MDVKEALLDLRKRMEEGRIKFSGDDLAAELLAVKMDASGEPILETVGPLVRATLLALRGVRMQEKQ